MPQESTPSQPTLQNQPNQPTSKNLAISQQQPSLKTPTSTRNSIVSQQNTYSRPALINHPAPNSPVSKQNKFAQPSLINQTTPKNSALTQSKNSAQPQTTNSTNNPAQTPEQPQKSEQTSSTMASNQQNNKISTPLQGIQKSSTQNSNKLFSAQRVQHQPVNIMMSDLQQMTLVPSHPWNYAPLLIGYSVKDVPTEKEYLKSQLFTGLLGGIAP